MEIGVKVMTEKLLTGVRLHTCSAYLTFVAIDQGGKAITIPQVIPETEDEIRRYRQAGERREYRLAMRNRPEEPKALVFLVHVLDGGLVEQYIGPFGAIHLETAACRTTR